MQIYRGEGGRAENSAPPPSCSDLIQPRADLFILLSIPLQSVIKCFTRRIESLHIMLQLDVQGGMQEEAQSQFGLWSMTKIIIRSFIVCISMIIVLLIPRPLLSSVNEPLITNILYVDMSEQQGFPSCASNRPPPLCPGMIYLSCKNTSSCTLHIGLRYHIYHEYKSTNGLPSERISLSGAIIILVDRQRRRHADLTYIPIWRWPRQGDPS